MGLEKVQYFTCWTIWNYEVFENIMKKGGIYEGALRLKDEGLIDHICCSLHAVPGDIFLCFLSAIVAKRLIPVLCKGKSGVNL